MEKTPEQSLALMGKMKLKGLGWFLLNHKERYFFLIDMHKHDEIKKIYDREQIPDTFPKMAKEAKEYVKNIKK